MSVTTFVNSIIQSKIVDELYYTNERLDTRTTDLEEQQTRVNPHLQNLEFPQSLYLQQEAKVCYPTPTELQNGINQTYMFVVQAGRNSVRSPLITDPDITQVSSSVLTIDKNNGELMSSTDAKYGDDTTNYQEYHHLGWNGCAACFSDMGFAGKLMAHRFLMVPSWSGGQGGKATISIYDTKAPLYDVHNSYSRKETTKPRLVQVIRSDTEDPRWGYNGDFGWFHDAHCTVWGNILVSTTPPAGETAKMLILVPNPDLAAVEAEEYPNKPLFVPVSKADYTKVAQDGPYWTDAAGDSIILPKQGAHYDDDLYTNLGATGTLHGYSYWYNYKYDTIVLTKYGDTTLSDIVVNPSDVGGPNSNVGFGIDIRSLSTFSAGMNESYTWNGLADDGATPVSIAPLEARLMHDEENPCGFVGSAVSSNIQIMYKENDSKYDPSQPLGGWSLVKSTCLMKPVSYVDLGFQGFPLTLYPTLSAITLTVDDQFLLTMNARRGDVRLFKVIDQRPATRRAQLQEVGRVVIGGHAHGESRRVSQIDLGPVFGSYASTNAHQLTNFGMDPLIRTHFDGTTKTVPTNDTPWPGNDKTDDEGDGLPSSLSPFYSHFAQSGLCYIADDGTPIYAKCGPNMLAQTSGSDEVFVTTGVSQAWDNDFFGKISRRWESLSNVNCLQATETGSAYGATIVSVPGTDHLNADNGTTDNIYDTVVVDLGSGNTLIPKFKALPDPHPTTQEVADNKYIMVQTAPGSMENFTLSDGTTVTGTVGTADAVHDQTVFTKQKSALDPTKHYLSRRPLNPDLTTKDTERVYIEFSNEASWLSAWTSYPDYFEPAFIDDTLTNRYSANSSDGLGKIFKLKILSDADANDQTTGGLNKNSDGTDKLDARGQALLGNRLRFDTSFKPDIPGAMLHDIAFPAGDAKSDIYTEYTTLSGWSMNQAYYNTAWQTYTSEMRQYSMQMGMSNMQMGN